jgi:hypothetical protein
VEDCDVFYVRPSFADLTAYSEHLLFGHRIIRLVLKLGDLEVRKSLVYPMIFKNLFKKLTVFPSKLSLVVPTNNETAPQDSWATSSVICWTSSLLSVNFTWSILNETLLTAWQWWNHSDLGILC